MVTVYTTTISESDQGTRIVESLSNEFPAWWIHIDLSDMASLPYPCGHSILRIAGEGIDPEKITALVRAMGFRCDVLEDKACNAKSNRSTLFYGWL